MLTKSEKSFVFVYVIIVILELVCSSLVSLYALHFITKPSVVISLICFLHQNTNDLDGKTKKITIWALTFSVLGDILLMFVFINQNFFIGGLISFMLAHLMYIKVFYGKHKFHKKIFNFLGILLIYVFFLFYILKNNLGNMLLPVILYMAVILLMVTMAFLRQGQVNKLSFILVFLGAITFIISDSLLALNKFYRPLPLANISIMLTYALAQLLIVFGLKKQS
ncbi:lysoplasmalogenase [Aestuariivivens sp. NBU2969]|uniref:lysoplasmalogenase n=1 Tax=Aestuariivivens sp. NBU2969 TaxID=2873267 RepID=UPI001CC17815|nr:lysoplasmalogenase [Aestuariivivens sp. NBU2969]